MENGGKAWKEGGQPQTESERGSGCDKTIRRRSLVGKNGRCAKVAIMTMMNEEREQRGRSWAMLKYDAIVRLIQGFSKSGGTW